MTDTLTRNLEAIDAQIAGLQQLRAWAEAHPDVGIAGSLGPSWYLRDIPIDEAQALLLDDAAAGTVTFTAGDPPKVARQLGGGVTVTALGQRSTPETTVLNPEPAKVVA